eukprot:403368285
MMFHGKIGYHDFETLFINDNEQDHLLNDMQGKYSMILKNHGLISVGTSITEAFWFHYYLETSCKLHVLTRSTGGKIKYPSEETVINTAAKYELWRNHNDHLEVSDSELLFDAAKRKIGYIFGQLMEFIDSHLHLWDLKQKINSWVVKSNDPHLMQNFTLNELMNFYAKEHSLAGFITIEAADGDNTLDEVKWLSQLSKSLPSNILHKHIAYINTTQNPEQFNAELAKFRSFDFIAGFRDICSFSSNSSYSPCTSDITLDEKKTLNLLANLKTLENHGYIYDCQIVKLKRLLIIADYHYQALMKSLQSGNQCQINMHRVM